jgi:hypothetical protein
MKRWFVKNGAVIMQVAAIVSLVLASVASRKW